MPQIMEILSSSAVIMVVMQLIKDIIPENMRKFIPVFSVIIGILLVYIFAECTTLQDCIKHGIAIGLGSTGTYQLGKGLYEKTNKVEEPILFDDHE